MENKIKINRKEVMNKVNKCINNLQEKVTANEFRISLIYDDSYNLGYRESSLLKINFFTDNIKYHIILYLSSVTILPVMGRIYDNENLYFSKIYSYQDLYDEIVKLFKYELQDCDEYLYTDNNNQKEPEVWFGNLMAKRIVSWVSSALSNGIVKIYKPEDITNIKGADSYPYDITTLDENYSNKWNDYLREYKAKKERI